MHMGLLKLEKLNLLKISKIFDSLDCQVWIISLSSGVAVVFNNIQTIGAELVVEEGVSREELKKQKSKVENLT